jgi:broad specificity phosphatase PhoE
MLTLHPSGGEGMSGMSERERAERDEDGIDENQEIVERVEVRAAQQRQPGAFDAAFLSNQEDVAEVILVRHGQQQFDPNGPAGQLVNPPLSTLGESQARLVGMALSTERINAVYASPLIRALETGREIARHHRLEPIIVDDLREVEIFRDVPSDQTVLDHVGRLVLMGTRHRMISEKSWDVYPLSEPSADFRRRVVNAIEGIIASHPNERVVVACHGGVINAYIGHVIGSKYDMFFRPAHTSISVVAGGNGVRALYRLNDVHHLMTAEGSFQSF